jgi:hypothetical protein
VSVDELVRGLNVALGRDSVDSCPAADSNMDEMMTVDELVRAVSSAIDGCG